MNHKIHSHNAGKVEAALTLANGHSNVQTYTSYQEIKALAQQAERQLEGKLREKDRCDVKYLATSGMRAPSSYKHPQQATSMILMKGPRDWFLTDVSSSSVWAQGGSTHSVFTPRHQAAHFALLSLLLWTVGSPASEPQEVPA